MIAHCCPEACHRHDSPCACILQHSMLFLAVAPVLPCSTHFPSALEREQDGSLMPSCFRAAVLASSNWA